MIIRSIRGRVIIGEILPDLGLHWRRQGCTTWFATISAHSTISRKRSHE